MRDLKLHLGPELRIVYPLILNFAVSGELELSGLADPKLIKPKGTLTFENGDVNLVATQVSSHLYYIYCTIFTLFLMKATCMLQITTCSRGFSHIFYSCQVRLKRDHPNRAKFEPEEGLDPTLDLALVGADWQLKIQGRASNWQDNLVVTSTRSGEQDVLSPIEVCIPIFQFEAYYRRYMKFYLIDPLGINWSDGRVKQDLHNFIIKQSR